MSPYSWPHASVAAPHPPVLLSLKKNTDEVDKKKQWPGDQATSSSLKMLLEYIIVGNEPPTSSLVSLGYDSIHVCFESPSSSTQCHHRKLPWVIQVSETNQLTTSSSKIIALQSTSPNDTLKVQEFHGWPCYLKKKVWLVLVQQTKGCLVRWPSPVPIQGADTSFPSTPVKPLPPDFLLLEKNGWRGSGRP